MDQVHHPTVVHQLLQLLWTLQLTLLPLLQTSSVKNDQEHPVSNCYSMLSTDLCLVRTTLPSLFISHIQHSPQLPLSRNKTSHASLYCFTLGRKPVSTFYSLLHKTISFLKTVICFCQLNPRSDLQAQPKKETQRRREVPRLKSPVYPPHLLR